MKRLKINEIIRMIVDDNITELLTLVKDKSNIGTNE
jgi:hypothetical protein